MRMAVSMGDAAGVGPEIILHSFPEVSSVGELVVVGDYPVLEKCATSLGYLTPLVRVTAGSPYLPGRLNVVDLGCLDGDVPVGRISRETGAAALAYVEAATRMVLSGHADAIVTLPVNKEAVRLGAPSFTGHTEHIARMCGADRTTMMLVSERLIVTHISTHVSMLDAVKALTVERIGEVIGMTWAAVKRLGNAALPIAVAGLNPHAGENGAFGREELNIIAPAVREARRRGIDVVGPVAPDTVFLQCVNGRYGAVVCMYHDQGHIPMKLLDFEGGVNVTLGLPIVRTSVDHGTAFDIAWKGVASTRSFVEACRIAQQLAH